jgi:CRISPR/Cas system-associated endonuclease Cas1
MLNLYTIVVGEVMGLDPALGYIYLDAHHRDSLALDLAEVSRPEVDGLSLRPHLEAAGSALVLRVR